MEKSYTFKGEEYSSYYQLEKVMGIPRKTIQYRHEVIGIPIDEVPDFKPKPPIERFGKKNYFPVSKSKGTEDELKQIIEYPKAPDFHIDSNQERTEEGKAKYAEWLLNAPEALLQRELRIYEVDQERLLAEEENKYFYESTYHEEEKKKTETAIQIIHDIAAKREIENE